MFLDIDHFKHVNDSKGHAYGDVLLQQVAARLRQSVDDSELVARLGGDEFTVLVDAFIDETDLSRIAHRILTKFREPFVLDGEDISISPSIGISLYPHHGEDATTLLRCADMALYRAKEAGRATYSFYDHDMQEHSLRRFNLESALRRALEKNELELYFQPRSTIRSGVISGYEALVRWRSSTLGAVPPDEFIAVAENIGVINAIGDWVLLAACSKAAEWHAQQLPSRISVNLSARQLQQIGLAERVQSILIATNFPPGLLEVEITESILLSSEPIVRNNLTQLRRLGIKLALDDFGTGYSTFSYLKKHKFDTIKIARDFVKDIGNEESAGAIAVAIIELAHNLNMRVVAEGVETEAQYEFLRKVGCEEVQGYYVGHPDPEPTQYLRDQLKIFDNTH
jgi:diguanylate cyclase (GGDEF)-like protein